MMGWTPQAQRTPVTKHPSRALWHESVFGVDDEWHPWTPASLTGSRPKKTPTYKGSQRWAAAAPPLVSSGPCNPPQPTPPAHPHTVYPVLNGT